MEEYNDTIYLSAESPCKGKPLALESAGFFDYGHCRTAIGWLWNLRDFLIMGIAALLSVVILVQTHIFLPAAATLLYAFLSIRLDDTTIIDYLRYAVKFFISTQQYFEWR